MQQHHQRQEGAGAVNRGISRLGLRTLHEPRRVLPSAKSLSCAAPCQVAVAMLQPGTAFGKAKVQIRELSRRYAVMTVASLTGADR